MKSKLNARKKLQILAVICAALVLCGASGLLVFGVYQTVLCIRVAKKLPVPDLQPLQFVLYGSGGDTVSARFRLNDADGREIVQIERSWNGRELFVDFISAKIAGKIFQIPVSIYSDERQNANGHSGTYLPWYFLNDEYCGIFFYEGQSSFEQAAFLRLSRYVLNIARFFPIGARLESVSVSLNSCERGTVYTIMTDTSGGLFLTEE